ncbi:MAG: hypothetical protein U1E83_07200 [Methylotetracoccus sp.]
MTTILESARRLWPVAKPVVVRVAQSVLAVFLLSCLLLALVLSREPSATAPGGDRQDIMRRTRVLLRSSVPTDRHQTVVRKVVSFTASDLESAANYALSRRKLVGFANVAIRDNRLRMQGSVKVPWVESVWFVNFRVLADNGDKNVVIRQLKLGRLAVPYPLVGWMIKGLAQFGRAARYAHIVQEVVREYRIVDDRVRVDFDWNRKVLAQADDLVTDFAMKERMLAYHRRLAEVVRNPEIKKYVRLSSLFQPLFSLARTRSEAAPREPVEENRALILTLSAYVNGRNLADAFGVTAPEFLAPQRFALLSRRADTAQHFVTSAALVVSGTRTLADVVGLAKELNDTHSGTGFSFTDLAADRAGANFGKFAISSDQAALRLQTQLANSADESLFMPSMKDLPENMPGEEFERRFGSVESPEFGELRRVIEERVAACPIYRF